MDRTYGLKNVKIGLDFGRQNDKAAILSEYNNTPYPFHRSISHDNAENRHWTWFLAKSTAVATPVILTPRKN